MMTNNPFKYQNVTYSKVSASVEPGKTNLIAVDGDNGEEGLAILNYSLTIPPDDSLCFSVKTEASDYLSIGRINTLFLNIKKY